LRHFPRLFSLRSRRRPSQPAAISHEVSGGTVGCAVVWPCCARAAPTCTTLLALERSHARCSLVCCSLSSLTRASLLLLLVRGVMRGAVYCRRLLLLVLSIGAPCSVCTAPGRPLCSTPAAAICCRRRLCHRLVVLLLSLSSSSEEEVKKEEDFSTGPLSVLMQSVKQNTPVRHNKQTNADADRRPKSRCADHTDCVNWHAHTGWQ
jgi:hypothetical protein